MTAEGYQKALVYILKDFSSETDAARRKYSVVLPQRSERSKQVRAKSPQPYMVYFILVTLLGFKYWGRAEKVAWEIPVLYKGTPFLLAHRKFGFDVRTVTPTTSGTILLAREMLDSLSKAGPIADFLLQSYVGSRIDEGAMTLRNQYGSFEMMYKFFRQKARKAYTSPPAKVKPVLSRGRRVGMTHDIFKNERQGFFYTSAMVDAYFSRLEHLLVLSLPFTIYDPVTTNLARFLTTNWGAKFKTVFNLTANKTAKILYERLQHIKENFRNTVFHGGFSKDGGSLFFHSEIGAIPVRLSKQPRQYSFYPMDKVSFKEICILFDSLDRFIQKHTSLGYAFKYIEAGLDVAFDESSRMKYRQAMTSKKSFEAFIEYESYLYAVYANMDF